jgi:hypothetical protein
LDISGPNLAQTASLQPERTTLLSRSTSSIRAKLEIPDPLRQLAERNNLCSHPNRWELRISVFSPIVGDESIAGAGALHRRLRVLEAYKAEKPMSAQQIETIHKRLWAKLQLVGVGRELPACCKQQEGHLYKNPESRERRERLIARLDRLAAFSDVKPVKFTPLPDDELDRLELFLIESSRHDHS